MTQQVLQYIADHPDVAFDVTLVTALDIDKPQANEILFNLIHEELIAEEDGRMRITDKGMAYPDSLDK